MPSCSTFRSLQDCYLLHCCLLALQDYTAALALFEERDLGGGDLPNPFLHNDRGLVRSRLGDYSAAVSDISTARSTFTAIGDDARSSIALAGA
jgi:hypothetical protein